MEELRTVAIYPYFGSPQGDLSLQDAAVSDQFQAKCVNLTLNA